jgi:ubiquinone/menaquinone biosynthesis C-methylase UbiE
MTENEQFQIQKDDIRRRLCKYTRKAFLTLPSLDKPRILDIGCGSGVSTLELAELSNGEIIGIDIDQSALNRFNKYIEKAGLATRVQALNCSMFNMNFTNHSFNIIWSEGSIYAVGFENGLREWERLLTSDGYMVIHDEKGDVSKKLHQISSCSYEILDYFILDQETWWTEYFAPLEKLINESRKKTTDDPKILEELSRAQEELDFFRKYPERNSSVCFVIKKS